MAGAISITAFREKADIAALKGLVPTLLTTTAAISRDLGWREPAADKQFLERAFGRQQ